MHYDPLFLLCNPNELIDDFANSIRGWRSAGRMLYVYKQRFTPLNYQSKQELGIWESERSERTANPALLDLRGGFGGGRESQWG